jgi:hypothetical protein
MYDMIKILYTITNPFITSQQSLTITILHILKYKFVYTVNIELFWRRFKIFSTASYLSISQNHKLSIV